MSDLLRKTFKQSVKITSNQRKGINLKRHKQFKKKKDAHGPYHSSEEQ